MNKNDYIAQVDSIEFSPDLESKIIDGVSLAAPKKRRYAFPVSVAACLLLVVVVIALPMSASKNKMMSDSAEAEVQTTDGLMDVNLQTYSSESKESVTGGTALLWHRLDLSHDNGLNLTKSEYEAECERLRDLGYEAVVKEKDDIYCIVIAINPYYAENFSDTAYNFEFTLLTE